MSKPDLQTAERLLQLKGQRLKLYEQNPEKNKKKIRKAKSDIDELFKNGPKELKSDKNFIIGILKENKNAFQYASDDFKKDFDRLKVTLYMDIGNIEHVNKEIYQNRDFVLCAVKRKGFNLEFAAQFHDDEEVVREAINQTGFAARYASERLKRDNYYMMHFVQERGYILSDLSVELQNDEKIVKAAVNNVGQAIEYALDGLKNNEKIAMSAVMKRVHNLEYVSSEFLK